MGDDMKLSEIMKRAKFERGAKNVILNLIFTDIEDANDVRQIYDYALSFVTKMPNNSMMLLFDLRGLATNAEIDEQLEKMTVDCSKYFKASSIVVDSRTEETMKSIAQKLGLSKMITYHDRRIANNYLMNSSL